jgi:hypothetical protein
MRAHRSTAALVLFTALALTPLASRAGNIPLEEPAKRRSSPASSVLDVAWAVLAYLPNRVFDLTDVVRLQVRAGPGWALSARATRTLPLFIGGYKATWIGLPGPRGRAAIPFPAGISSQSGFNLGPTLSSSSQSPYYGAGEFGAGVQLYFLGFDAGFDVVELADFFAGFACVDLSHDDF